MSVIYRHFCLVLILFFSFSVFSQKTGIYTNPDKDYHKGLELFNKQKYSAAQNTFNAVLKNNNDDLSDIKTDAQYFSANCAIELFNKDAEYLITKFIAEHPESPRIKTAYFQMGRFQFRKKRYYNVIKCLEKVDPYDLNNDEKPEYYFKLAYGYFNVRKFEEASKSFYEIKDTKSKYTIPAIYYYAHIAYLEKNYETALQGFLKLKDNEMFEHIIPYYITQIYYYQNKFDLVLEYAPPLLDSASTKRAPDIARIIAEAYYRSEKYKESLPYFEIYKKKSKSFTREDIYQIGYAYYKISDYENAAKNFVSVTNSTDSIAQNAYYHLADCYIKTNEKEKARMAFSSASKLDFNAKIKEDAMFNYAKLTYELAYSPFNDAIKALQKYVDEYPKSERLDEAYKYLGEVYMTTKNYKGAVETLENIQDITVDIERSYQKVSFYYGLQLINDADYIQAIINFDKSLNNARYNQLFKAQAIFWKGEAYYMINRFDDAIKYYNEFVLTQGSYGSDIFNTAHYNLGYGYFKIKNYEEAIVWFRKYVDRMKDAQIVAVGDAYNRIGDCYFVSGAYDKAIDYYLGAINNGKISIDYAMFQKAFCHGLTKEKDFNQKIVILTQLVNEYPNSSYTDDALYEIGNSYVEIESPDMALVYYEQLIDEYPKSSYIKKAFLKLGMIGFNQDDYSSAKENYEKVITEFPNTEEFDLALVYLKEIYIEQDDADGYINYVKSLGGGVDISVAEEDSLTYITAEKSYMAGNYVKAKPQLEKYINKFANGNYILNAHFYNAECEFRNGKEQEALISYNYVISRLKNIFTEHALVRASGINFKLGNYNEALANYTSLEEIAEFNNNILLSRIGKMRCYRLLENYQEAKQAAIKVLAKEKVSDEIYREAHFIIGKAYYLNNEADAAFDEFSIISQDAKTKEGSESRYYLAKIYFGKDDLDNASNEVMDFNKQGTPHQYWLAKSIILLAEIYLKKEDNFQAKHTLQSIIDNYGNKTDGIIDEANAMLAAIIETENKAIQPIEETPEIIDFGVQDEIFDQE
ncbi:MAG: tetratricopeptide repeat protein [Bacteroidota bacterium]